MHKVAAVVVAEVLAVVVLTAIVAAAVVRTVAVAMAVMAAVIVAKEAAAAAHVLGPGRNHWGGAVKSLCGADGGVRVGTYSKSPK